METLMEIQNLNENAERFMEAYIGGLRDLYENADPMASFIDQQEEYKAFASSVINSKLSDEVKLGFFDEYNKNDRKADLKTLFKNINVVQTTLEIKEQYLSEYLKADKNQKLEFEEFIKGMLDLGLDQGNAGSGYLSAYIADNAHVEGLMHHQMVWMIQELSRKNLLKEIRTQLANATSNRAVHELTPTQTLLLKKLQGAISTFIGGLRGSIIRKGVLTTENVGTIENSIVKIRGGESSDILYDSLKKKGFLMPGITKEIFAEKMKEVHNLEAA